MCVLAASDLFPAAVVTSVAPQHPGMHLLSFLCVLNSDRPNTGSKATMLNGCHTIHPAGFDDTSPYNKISMTKIDF